MKKTTSVSRLKVTLVLLAAFALGGCAATRSIDSDVQSFAGTPAATKGATYTFERLPSQQTQADSQLRLESFAEKALARAGLVRDDVKAQYNVQLTAHVEQTTRAIDPPMLNPRVVMASDGSLWQRVSPIALESKSNRYRVQLVLRDVIGGKVAYESSAVFEGPWSDSANLLPVLLEAALRDFPNPPAGVRKVTIELPAVARPSR